MDLLKIIHMLSLLIECQTFYLVIDSIWGAPKRNEVFYIYCSIVMSIILPFLYLNFRINSLGIAQYMVLFLILQLLCYKLPLVKQILTGITGVVLLNIFEFCLTMVVQLALRLGKIECPHTYINFIVLVILFVGFFFLRIYISRKQLYIFDVSASLPVYIFEMFACIAMFVCVMILSEMFLIYNSVASPEIVLVGVIGFSGALVGFVLLYRLLVSRKIYQQNSEFNRKLLLLKEDYYKKLLNSQDETKKIQHDIKNNLIVLKQLIDTEKYNEADNFLHDLVEQLQEIQKIYSVGNEIVDLIINDKFSLAARNNIKCSIEGLLPGNLNVSTLDLCTIFSNLLDNAIEGCEKVESDRKINLVIRNNEREILVMLTNTCALDDFAPTDKLKTTKEDGNFSHGYGTENVKASVRKYNGWILYNCQNKIFNAKMVLPFCEKNE